MESGGGVVFLGVLGADGVGDGGGRDESQAGLCSGEMSDNKVDGGLEGHGEGVEGVEGEFGRGGFDV